LLVAHECGQLLRQDKSFKYDGLQGVVGSQTKSNSFSVGIDYFVGFEGGPVTVGY